MMNNNKFEYFLNAVHYCIWLSDMKFGEFMGRIVNTLFSPIPKYLFTKEYKKKYYERLSEEQKKIDKFFYDKEIGYHIAWAHHWFGFFYSGYPCFFSWLLLGIASRVYGDEVKGMVVLLIFSFPVALGYIPAYRAVFSKDRYLKYFKQFEKENEQWHKKWKMITWAFCIGALITMAIGFFCMAIITSV